MSGSPSASEDRRRRSLPPAWPPVYPFLLAAFPFAYLLAENIHELPIVEAVRPLVVTEAVVLGLILILGLAGRSFGGSGLFVTGAVLLFFSYGHVYGILEPVRVAGIQLGRHRYLVPLFATLTILCAYVSLVRIAWPERLSQVGLVMAVVLLALPLYQIGRGVIVQRTDWQAGLVEAGDLLESDDGLPLPDVYYIILDAYARGDYMLGRHGFNNGEFLNQLEAWGFYVADQSNANHMWTALSIASSLNMRYAFDLGLQLAPSTYPGIFIEPIRHSQVRRILEGLGYQTVGVPTGYLPTEIVDADIYFQLEGEPDRGESEGILLTRFENLVVYSSAGLVLTDWLGPALYDWVGFRTDHPYDELRRIVLFEFDAIPRISAIEAPTFAFIHIAAPHSPYLFGPNGESREPSGAFTLIDGEPDAEPSTSALYRDQAIYISMLTERAIESILAGSETRPVIILQSDHGPGVGGEWRTPEGATVPERTAILNAYLLPEACRNDLYSTITPVNSFRVLMNCAFGQDFEMLDDQVYFSYWPRRSPYEFIDVTDMVRINVSSDKE